MTISVLSEATTRVLGSTVVLNDATSVIKELIDNALDARATSVAIEVSTNTIDVIQVKDNGTGIGVEDRQLLCRRSYTSKIRTLDDLERLGGRFLGFRGEALASIANLSDSVVVTTCVEGELVGSVLKYDLNGKLLSSASAPHPVGTSVKVLGFLTSIPVRKQTALKSSNKTLLDIRQLMYNYAFARPNVRFILKVLKSKSDKLNWSYAPCNTVHELSATATKIIGKEMAAICKQHTIATHVDELVEEQKSTFEMRSLLMDSKIPDIAKVTNVGQFVSLDGRPMNAERGTIKALMKLYKLHLQQALGGNTRLPTKPFLCLHICCPPGSYDINIEPAKGEVMFHEPTLILELAEKIFKRCYGELRDDQTLITSTSKAQSSLGSSFDLLLARKPYLNTDHATHKGNNKEQPPPTTTDNIANTGGVTVEAISQNTTSEIDTQSHHAEDVNRHFRDMYSIDDDDDDGHIRLSETSDVRAPRELDDDAPTSMDNLIRNPFTTAKMHALLHPRMLDSTTDQHINGRPTHRGLSKSRQNRVSSSSLGNSMVSPEPRTPFSRPVPYLPTPGKSPGQPEVYQNPGPPLQRRQPRLEEDTDCSNSIEPRSSPNRSPAQRNSLERWVKPLPPSMPDTIIRPARGIIDEDTGTAATNDDSRGPFQEDIYSPSTVSSMSIIQPPLYRPFRSPLKISQDSRNSRASGQPLGMFNQTIGFQDPSQANSNSDLDEIMEFEHRKKALNQRRKGNSADLARIQRDSLGNKSPVTSFTNDQTLALQESNLAPLQHDFATKFHSAETSVRSPKSNPHYNRYLAATRDLANRSPQKNSTRPDISIKPELQDDSIQDLQITLPPSDPRAYLLSTKVNTTLGQKQKRINLSRLPFETIPQNSLKHNISAVPSTPFPTSTQLTELTSTLSKSDPYIRTGKIKSPPLDPFSPSINSWEYKIQDLIKATHRSSINSGTGSEGENLSPGIAISLSRAIEAHINAAMATE